MSLLPSDGLTTWSGHGVAFQYPDIWELTEEYDGTDAVISVAADDSCFWILRILSDGPRPADVLESCLEAFRDEYEEVEVLSIDAVLAEMPAQCRELEFYCHELLNTAMLSCVRTLEMTLFVWWQGTDHELPHVRAHFDHMSQSVRILSLADPLRQR